MKILIVSIFLFMSLPVSAQTEDLAYTLEVKAMFCAYCAYNVSKQLKSLDGVLPESVDVDLANDLVTFESEKPLAKNRLAKLMESAGFQMGTVTETTLNAPAIRSERSESVLMSLTFSTNQLADGHFDAVLDALGSVAAQRSTRIAIEAPEDLEATILRPVLAGRKTVIDVDYRPVKQSNKSVLISLLSE